MAAYYVSIIPEGTGLVRKMPFIDDSLVSYKLTENDKSIFEKYLKKLCDLLFSAGALRVLTGTGDEITKENIDNFIINSNFSDHEVSSVHLFSSLVNDASKKTGYLDVDGQVIGQEGLYVADASLLPSPPGVNPQGVVMALSSYLSDRILGVI